jgi:hypothetical protein
MDSTFPTSYTVGASELTVRVEYYQQILNINTATPVSLQGLDLYPSLKAVLVQFGFSY